MALKPCPSQVFQVKVWTSRKQPRNPSLDTLEQRRDPLKYVFQNVSLWPWGDGLARPDPGKESRRPLQ